MSGSKGEPGLFREAMSFADTNGDIWVKKVPYLIPVHSDPAIGICRQKTKDTGDGRRA